MATIQSAYSENIRTGFAGMLPNMVDVDLVSRNVEAAGGLAFGKAAVQGTLDDSCRLFANGDTIQKFIGVVVAERSVLSGSGFSQYESARLLRKGAIMVIADVAVAASDPVWITQAGGFSNVTSTGAVQIPNARWEDTTSGTLKLATIFIK